MIPSSASGRPPSSAVYYSLAIRQFLFIVSGIVFAALWLFEADTENALPEVPPFNSVVGITRATGYAPFTYRRLVFDLADIITRATPESFWQLIDRVFTESSLGKRIAMARPFRSWPRAEIPLLCTVSVLICASYCGFIYTCRYLFELFYISPVWFKDVGSVALGFLALGSMGGYFFSYPYDIPQMFVFTLCCSMIFANSLWFFPLFIAAAYSKETSFLLIPLYWLCQRNRYSVAALLKCFLLLVVYFAIHWYVVKTYPGLPYNFVALKRNLWKLGTFAIFYSWNMVTLFVVVLLSIKEWHRFPKPLRNWVWLFPIVWILALYQGWIEERRMYLEFVAPFGFLGLQVVTKLAGCESVMRPKLDFVECDTGASALGSEK